jgi:hypothetical protein
MGVVSQFAVGGAISIVNIAIHALVMTWVVRVARSLSEQERSSKPLFLPCIMIGVVSVLMAAHACEVLVWSLAYSVLGVIPEGTSPVYFAFVNYTTLGYGDVLPVKAWQMLGPITAMNGVLMFGWSTAVIFEVLRRSLELDPAISRAHRRR